MTRKFTQYYYSFCKVVVVFGSDAGRFEIDKIKNIIVSFDISSVSVGDSYFTFQHFGMAFLCCGM